MSGQLLPTAALGNWPQTWQAPPSLVFQSWDDATVPASRLRKVTVNGTVMLSDLRVVLDQQLVRMTAIDAPVVVPDQSAAHVIDVYDTPWTEPLRVIRERLPLLAHLNRLGRVQLHETSLGAKGIGITLAGLVVGAIAPMQSDSHPLVVVVDGDILEVAHPGEHFATAARS